MAVNLTWVWRGLAGLVLVVFVAASGGYLWLRTSLPRVSGDIVVAGASANIEIIRDRHAVPHIRAKNAEDAYFGLGFVHAQDRLSEVVGPPTVGLDRMMRTLGLYRLAEDSVTRLSPAARRMLAAYSSGINSFLTGRSGALPPEFLVLGYKPAPWRLADSLVWARIMAMRLTGNWRTEALRARLSSRLTPQQIDELWPGDDGNVVTTVTAWTPELKKHQHLFADLLKRWPRELSSISASNSWGIGGKHSATSKPLLANDPHLGFRAPGLWYLARIESPGLTLTGATVPGVPYHILGHNGKIAWAITSSGSDTQDLFIEKIAPDNPDSYMTPEGAQPFETRQETISVAGAPDVTITIRNTRHGPVLSDARRDLESLGGGGHVIALAAATFAKGDATPEALHRLNRAGNWAEFRAALRMFHSPQQNITYADLVGNIGFIAPGRVPIRKAGNGEFPAPGWTGSHDWTGFIPFEALPSIFNPASGRIANANNRIAPVNYPYFLGNKNATSYRAERIHQMLDSYTKPPSIGDFAEMQADSKSLMARDLMPLMTRFSPRDDRTRRTLVRLRAWDQNMARNQSEPLIFTAWLRTLNRLIYADELGAALPAYWGLRPLFVRNVLTKSQKWCDNRASEKVETCDDMLQAALDATLDELEAAHGGDQSSWRWGDDHYANFSHSLFGRIAMVRHFSDIRIAANGGGYTVNRADHHVNNPAAPFASIHGAGYRAIYDLADLDRSRFIQATGQSGNFLSSHYRDITEKWRDGEHITIPASRARALDGAIGILTLKPES
jgi:penicillin amidase